MNNFYTVYREDGRFWVVAGKVASVNKVRDWFLDHIYEDSPVPDLYHSISGPLENEIKLPESNGRRFSGKLAQLRHVSSHIRPNSGTFGEFPLAIIFDSMKEDN